MGGGLVYDHIQRDFSSMGELDRVIPADVLDAWYPPAPLVLERIAAHLEWASHTSPPLHGQGLRSELARRRAIDPAHIVLGCGSSDLIFRLVPHFLSLPGPIAIPAPCYGEYGHVLEQIHGRPVALFHTDRNGFEIDLDRFSAFIEKTSARGVCIVNPCNPSGRFIKRQELIELVAGLPDVRFVIDETYIEYLGAEHSLESLCMAHENLMIIKSMSKIYALSGVRVGYAVVGSAHARTFIRRTPPYIVSTLGQMAAITALRSMPYYERRLAETRRLRQDLSASLSRIPGIRVVPSVINSLLLDLAETSWTAARLVEALARQGLLCRDISSQGLSDPQRYLRLAVLGDAHNHRSVEIIRDVLGHPA